MKEIYCKNCRYYRDDSFKVLFPGYIGESPYRCMRNAKKKKNPIGEVIKNVGEDCLVINANLHCKYFEQKQKWYQKLFNTLKLIIIRVK